MIQQRVTKNDSTPGKADFKQIQQNLKNKQTNKTQNK